MSAGINRGQKSPARVNFAQVLEAPAHALELNVNPASIRRGVAPHKLRHSRRLTSYTTGSPVLNKASNKILCNRLFMDPHCRIRAASWRVLPRAVFAGFGGTA